MSFLRVLLCSPRYTIPGAGWHERITLIYENAAKDPEFYDEIVAKVEAYAQSRNLQKNTTMNTMDKVGLDGSRFKESDPGETVAFFASQGGFKCSVSTAGISSCW